MEQQPVGVAVIGLGRVSRSHLDGLRHWPSLGRLVAVVDVREDLARSVAREFQVDYYTDVTAALEDDRIDAVVVCLPHSLHARVTIEAAEKGKHVLVEKPMATCLEDGQAMVAAAEKNGVRLMIGQSRRFIYPLMEAKRRLHEIGNLINLLYVFACYFDVRTAPAWWRSREATGGLVYPMLGSHSVDYTLWVNEGKKPVSVYAQGCSHNPDFEGDDDATIVITFEDGSHATNFLSINNRPSRHEGLLIGTRGSIYFTHSGDHEGLIGVPDTQLQINGQWVTFEDRVPHNFALQMREFLLSILERREPRPSGREVLTQLRVIEAAMQSAAEGRVIPLTNDR